MLNNLSTGIIAAGAALSGVLLSQIISVSLSLFDKRHQRLILHRQKYEEMMFYFQDSLTYLELVQGLRTFDQLRQRSPPSQTARAYGLALLYFPTLQKPLEQYTLAQVSFYNTVVELFDEGVGVTVGALLIRDERYRNAIDVLLLKKNAVMESLELNTKKYTKA